MKGSRLSPFAPLALLAALSGACGAQTPSTPEPSRGELLYSTHCISCHTTQVHWRQYKLATDWPSLLAQVRRWQASAALAWDDADIFEVARYLDERYYRFGPARTGPVIGRCTARPSPDQPAQC
jgi:mono/diheme cytochrome c family protein